MIEAMKTRKQRLFSILVGAVYLGLASGYAWAQAVKVEVVAHDGKYQLLRGGKPYPVKGAGLDDASLESLAAHGSNSVRTWSTVDGPEGTALLLDRAHALGMTVSLCLYAAPERLGFDYYDEEAVARQYEALEQEVLKYKDHPALLTWIIGNELNFQYKNPRVYDAVNDISLMIHEVDPNHPTTTTIAGFTESLVKIIHERAPDLDFISFQLYAQLNDLPGFIKDTDFTDPFFITEWGAIGHWEVPRTSWGAPLEQDSTAKAETYLRGYREVIEPLAGQSLGNYVFFWGQKQEKTPTWYGMFTETGEETEAIDVMQYVWTGNWPENRSPQIESMRLDGKAAHKNIKLKPGKTYKALISASDHDGDELSYSWQVKPESTATQVGGDYEAQIASLEGHVLEPASREARLIAPDKPGAYRLFVYVYDGRGHAAHANIPFHVDGK
jgi:hypothetical protein